MPKRKHYQPISIKKVIIKSLLKTMLIAAMVAVSFGALTFAFFAKDLPTPDRIGDRFVTQSTKIYDRTGKTILYDIHGEEKRTVIPETDIPQYIKEATIAIEDQNFYNHFGIDLRAIINVLFSSLKGKRLRGASTITQQFIKNSVLSNERTLTRKIKEAILAIEL